MYKRLRNIDAAISIESEQNELMDEAKGLIADICNDHLFAAQSFLHDEELKAALSQDIKDECQELVEYIQATKRFNLEVNSRSKDRVVSFGEKLSCRFMTYLLKDRVCTTNSPMCYTGLFANHVYSTSKRNT